MEIYEREADLLINEYLLFLVMVIVIGRIER